MASQVSICNRALQKLGAARINSITEGSRNARSCLDAYEPRLRAMLEMHEWGFSIKRVQLAADATAPDFGKQNRFPLPADFIRLCHSDPFYNDNFQDWVIENGYIYTDYSGPLDVRYVSYVTDTNKMTSLFCEAFSADMAFEMCEEITQSNTKKESLERDKIAALREAKKSNGMQKPASDMPDDSWVTARS